MSEKLRILEMLDQGTITVQEANQLLEAVQDSTPQAAEQEAGAPPAVSPNMQRFRRLSYIPLGVSLLLLLLVGWGTFALSRRVDGRITAGFVAMLVLLVFFLLATLLAFAMTRMPWLHVRIQSRDQETPEGKRTPRKLAISLPVPLSLARWGLSIASRFAGEEHAGELDLAANLLQSVRHDLGKPGTDPIVVDVDDADEHVQIYLG